MEAEIKKFVIALGEMYKLFGDEVVIAWANKEVKKIVEKYK